MKRTVLAAVWLSLGGIVTPSFAQDEFHAFVLPEHAFTPLGSTVGVSFEVDATAQQFNGYEVTIKFDPDIVSFQSVEEGSLMETCANRFTFLSATDSTVTYTHVVLCAGLALDGPGELSRYIFEGVALGVSPTEVVSSVECTFFDAGDCVAPDHPTYPRQVVFHDGDIHVYDPLVDVPGDTPVPNIGFTARVFPNPARGAAWLEIGSTRDEPVIVDVLGPDGRRVFSWPETAVSSGTLRLPWPTSGRDGSTLGAGVYFYRVRSGRDVRVGKLMLLK